MSTRKQNGVESIRRAITIIRALTTYHQKGARLSTIARKVDLPIATTKRILMVLCSEKFAVFDQINKHYHLGPDMYSCGRIPQHAAMRTIYRPSIERISQETEDTVYLALRSGNDTLCLDRSEGPGTIRIIFDVGMRLPMGIGASGLAILSVLPEKEVETILAANSKRLSALNPDVSLEKVRRVVMLARQRGYAVNEGQHHKGIYAVGIALIDARDVAVGAITVASTAERMNPARCRWIAEVIKSTLA